MRVKNIGFWIILLSIITLIFSPAIIYPFFQDDFFALVTTKITSLSDIWRLFLPVSEAVYWRPLGIQLYFGVMQFLGLGRPIWFHLASLMFHLLNTYLVYKLILGKLVGGNLLVRPPASLREALRAGRHPSLSLRASPSLRSGWPQTAAVSLANLPTSLTLAARNLQIKALTGFCLIWG